MRFESGDKDPRSIVTACLPIQPLFGGSFILHLFIGSTFVGHLVSNETLFTDMIFALLL
jgi:hypothetical protein